MTMLLVVNDPVWGSLGFLFLVLILFRFCLQFLASRNRGEAMAGGGSRRRRASRDAVRHVFHTS